MIESSSSQQIISIQQTKTSYSSLTIQVPPLSPPSLFNTP
jgi:hypothetical protein